MLHGFSEGLAGDLSRRWMTLWPSLMFWLALGAVYGYRTGWDSVIVSVEHAEEKVLILRAVGVLLLVTSTAIALQPLVAVVIRLLEGYWTIWPLSAVHAPALRLRRWQVARMRSRYHELDASRSPSPRQSEQLARLEERLNGIPDSELHGMPTSLGDVLRAGEVYSQLRYGLDAVAFWPRLWLLLPKEAKSEIVGARSSLEVGARCWLFSALFFVIMAICREWLPALAGIAGAWIAYKVCVSAAERFADLVRSAYDLYRFRLYELMRWHPPVGSATERASGEALTEFVVRGHYRNPITYTLGTISVRDHPNYVPDD